MKLVYLPDFRKEFSDTEHIQDLKESVDITIEDLLEHLIEDFPGTHVVGPNAFREVALGIVAERVLREEEVVDIDVEGLISLVEETLEIIHTPFRRLMLLKSSKEKWVVINYVPNAIVVKRRKDVF